MVAGLLGNMNKHSIPSQKLYENIIKMKPKVVVELGEYIEFSVAICEALRDNGFGKVCSYYQHNHISNGEPNPMSYTIGCNCELDNNGIRKAFWKNGLINNYDLVDYNYYQKKLKDKGLLKFVTEMGSWNDFLSKPFDFDVLYLGSQLYWSDIVEILINNSFVNRQLKEGSVAFFEGGGKNHPRIKKSQFDLSNFHIENICGEKYSLSKAEYK
jgi:hypothetical protein